MMGCWYDKTIPAGEVSGRPDGFDPKRDQVVAVSIRAGDRTLAERVQVFRWHLGRTLVGMDDLRAWTARASAEKWVAPATPLGRLLILDPRGPGQAFTVALDRWPYRMWAPWYGLRRFGRLLTGWWLVNAHYFRTVTKKGD